MKQYLVLDLGGTFIKYALMGWDGTFLKQGKTKSPLTSMEDLLDALEPIGREFEGQYEGAAVSMPGRIDTKNGIAHTGGSFRFIKDAPVGQYFEERLHVPVTVANDGKCAASAEAWSGSLSDVDNGAVLVLGTGIGGGIVLNKKVWMGSTFGAGELSTFSADLGKLSEGIPDFRSKNVEAVWTSYTSTTGLLRLYARRKGLPEREHGLDGLAFFRAYDQGEKEAAEAFEEFGRYTAAGIHAVQAVLDLQRFAIGGGISARPEVTEKIRQCVDRQFELIPFTPFGKPEIVSCKYGNDANLIGALSFHLERTGP
ncbi:MAG: ROK family protein [Hungatella sp.]|jgi:predicted NBD/HSP70 family sugar kinase|nr:ROK family protein [Hungatella sp.]